VVSGFPQASTYSKLIFLLVTLPFAFLICGFDSTSHNLPSLNTEALCYVTSLQGHNTYGNQLCKTKMKHIFRILFHAGLENMSLDRPVTGRLAFFVLALWVKVELLAHHQPRKWPCLNESAICWLKHSYCDHTIPIANKWISELEWV